MDRRGQKVHHCGHFVGAVKFRCCQPNAALLAERKGNRWAFAKVQAGQPPRFNPRRR